MTKPPPAAPYDPEKLLELLGGHSIPQADDFRQLILQLDTHRVLAKVFLLEGTPFVFEKSPMKYVIFREQVADRFGVGSQDVCIVGSARLGFSPAAYKYGTPFSKTSDVDVVIISEPLFDRGSRELFGVLNQMEPPVHKLRPFLEGNGQGHGAPPVVELSDWKDMKEAVRNFVFQNFNPGLLPMEHPLRREIFEKISSTAGLFLALEPKVFVSKIRGRVFRTWKAAEDYYANSLREVKKALQHGATDIESDDADGGEELKVK